MKNIIWALAALLIIGGCSRPRSIPKDTLGKIFKESFLANSYYSTHDFSPTDSLDIYRPILKKYGYNHRDLEYTVAEFSKQKSVKLSDILEQAIKELEAELKYYDGRVAVLDTIDARAARMFMREVYFAEQIKARTIADTVNLRITVPVKQGTYRVSYVYYIDSLDQNRGLRTVYTLIDSAGRHRNTNYNWLTPRRRLTLSTDIPAATSDREMQIALGGYGKDMTKPHLTVDSLRIEHFLPIEVARDSLITKFINLSIPPHGTTRSAPPDSVALRLYPFRHDSVGDGDH